ncbi:MAG: hypothetical protein Q9171_005447 [Xanthocarpia ochracea]
MNPTRQPSARLEQFVSFYILPMLTPSQRSLLISSLIHYDQLTGVGLLSKSNLFLTTLEEDIQILHISSFTLPPATPEQKLLLHTDYDRNVGLKLDAQSPTVLRVLQEDLRILHRSPAKPLLTNQANGEHGLTAKINEPYPLRNTIPQLARIHSPSVEAVDVSEWPGVETVKYKSTAPIGERLSTGVETLKTSPERGPATRSKKNLACAPPLSNPTTHESGPKQKRPVAADFFTPDCTPRPKSSKQGMSDFRSEDITRLLQVEKAKARSGTSQAIPKNLELGKVDTKTTSRRMTDSNKLANGKRTTGESTIAKLGPWEPNPYLRYTYQPQTNNYQSYPLINDLHGRRFANAVIPTWSQSPIEQPVEVGMEDMRPQPGQYSLQQGDGTTISSPTTRHTTAYAYRVPTKPKAEGKSRSGSHERKRGPEGNSNGKRRQVSNAPMQLGPGELLTISTDFLCPG